MTVRRIRVVFGNGEHYDIRIGQHLIVSLGTHLREIPGISRVVVVGDENTMPRFAKHVRASLEKENFRVDEITVPAGEISKSIDQAIALWDALADIGLSRDGAIIALGGGVIGDLAGFVASTYMRGIPCIQIPTTLLAMVDSSVGGKTAIDRPQGKNLVGTFTQPSYVAADLATLRSLPEAEWENGFAEICKSAMIDSEEFSVWLTTHAAELVAHDPDIVQQAIARAISFKAEVVTHDEREQGRRECLNYGHTFGHALEVVAGYGVISHGRAVAEGMRFAARLAVEVIGTSSDFVFAQDTLLDMMGLTALPQVYSPDDLLKHMMSDKKVRNGAIRFILPIGPGSWDVCEVPFDTLHEHLEAWARSKSVYSEETVQENIASDTASTTVTVPVGEDAAS